MISFRDHLPGAGRTAASSFERREQAIGGAIHGLPEIVEKFGVHYTSSS